MSGIFSGRHSWMFRIKDKDRLHQLVKEQQDPLKEGLVLVILAACSTNSLEAHLESMGKMGLEVFFFFLKKSTQFPRRLQKDNVVSPARTFTPPPPSNSQPDRL